MTTPSGCLICDKLILQLGGEKNDIKLWVLRYKNARWADRQSFYSAMFCTNTILFCLPYFRWSGCYKKMTNTKTQHSLYIMYLANPQSFFHFPILVPYVPKHVCNRPNDKYLVRKGSTHLNTESLSLSTYIPTVSLLKRPDTLKQLNAVDYWDFVCVSKYLTTELYSVYIFAM